METIMETIIKAVLVLFVTITCLMSISYPIRHNSKDAATEVLCGILFVIAVWFWLKGCM